ncbi:nitrogenase component I subunit alpha [Caldicellulosiruptor acetigenus]|uniref:nitrogenase component I subunit alpha n=1 Tax=Caldicellulosiruptor acetigenus TaxID=301953 RepID=UPI0003FCECB2|nr:nitrogenase component I subunit alpha [Caldicellulosiruptor acetigenus]WAM35808.1 nitrogenase component I subunit alpha [Caldicellulosiruptor acetigenus]
MPFVTLDCDRCIEERGKHTYITDRNNPVVPVCNVRTIPGDMTERGCAFAGARGVVGGPVKDVIQIVHGPIGCAYYTWSSRRHLSDSEFHRKYCFSTDMQEKDIVFGGEKKLYNAIIEANQQFPEAKAVFIYATCPTALIGDDLEAVAKKASKAIGKPVIAFNSPGFCGVSQSKGHHIANHTIFEKIVGTKELEDPTPYDVNIIGEYNIDGDYWVLEKLFTKIGLRIITAFTGNASYDNLCKMHYAKLNIVHCQRSATYIARLMKEKYGTPFIRVTLFGITETINSLREIGKFFGIEKKVEEVIEEELESIMLRLEFFREKLRGKRAMIYVGAPRVWHWIPLMRDLGIEVVACATTFGHEDDYEKINARADDGVLVIDNPNELELEEVIEKYKPDIFLTGLKEKYLAHKIGVPSLNSHSYENGPYVAFEGLVNFARDLYKSLYAPVWKFVDRRWASQWQQNLIVR